MSTLLALLLAAFLSALLGLERESEGKAAGLRTHLLVGVGAALATYLSLEMTGHGVGEAADPGRIAAQVVSGIGFIGAGVIIQSRGSVRGLTTAATLWVAAMIGMAVGLEAYGQAVAVTIISLLALRFLSSLDHLFEALPQWQAIEVTWTEPPDDAVAALDGLTPPEVSVRLQKPVSVREGKVASALRIRASDRDVSRIVMELGQRPEIREVKTL
ncbi:MAG: MgtC/SapB family protein [Gemmatimonadales bacterium]|nr:MAG: MgtC/SapB family protein [Gemmatimonadales bacterium]